jgi:hypothetical protein
LFLEAKCWERGCRDGFLGQRLRQEGFAVKWIGVTCKGEDTNEFTKVWDVVPSCMSSKVREHSMGTPDVGGWPWWSLERRGP